MKPFLSFLLVCLLLLAGVQAGLARSQGETHTRFLGTETHPVCSIKDFGEFIKEYGALSKEEQNICVKYPIQVYSINDLDLPPKIFKDFTSLSPHVGGKFVDAPGDIEDAANPFYMADREELDSQAGKYGYVYQEHGDNKVMLMLVGANDTFVYLATIFDYIDGKWIITELFRELAP